MTTATSTVSVISTDPNDASTGPWTSDGLDPVSLTITTGSFVFPMSLVTASTNGWTLSGTDLGAHSAPSPAQYNSFTTPAIPTIAGPAAKLLTLLPGETEAPGTATGKTGAVSPYVVGGVLNVRVKATDQFFNTVTVPPAPGGANNATIQIGIQGNLDPFAQVDAPSKVTTGASGQVTFVYNLYKATTEYFQATDITPAHGTPWTASVSSLFTAAPKPATNVLLLLPGESIVAGGGAPGKSGTPNIFVAGSSFAVTGYVTDQYFNPVTAHNAENIGVLTSDLYDTEPLAQTVINGQSNTQFTLQLRTAATNHTAVLIDDNVFDPGTTWLASTSPASGFFSVIPAAASQLVVIPPGQTFLPGSLTGRSGNPTAEVAGQNFFVTVYQTDPDYNLVSLGTMPTVLMTGNDPHITWVSPGNPAGLLPGQGYISFTVQPSSAQPAFVITASTDVATPGGTTGIMPGSSSSDPRLSGRLASFEIQRPADDGSGRPDVQRLHHDV